MNLQSAIDLFLGEYRPSTQKSYRHPLEAMRDYLGPARHVNEIKPVHLVEYDQRMRERDYAAATMNKHRKTIKTFFNWCVKMELLDKSPAHPLKTRALVVRQSRDKAIADDEVLELLTYLKCTNKVRDYAMVAFLADTGARARGAVELTLDRLHLDEAQPFAIVIEKGDKSRKVILGNLAVPALRRWLLRRPVVDNDYVFVTGKGKPLTANYLGQVIRRACDGAGIRRMSCHVFRRRKGFQFADAGIAPSLAATALGHDDVTITLKHYYPGGEQEALEAAKGFTLGYGEDQAHDLKKHIKIRRLASDD